MNKKIKLSDKQKEVIMAMRKGNMMTKYNVGVGIRSVDRVSVTTFFILLNNGLIKSFGRKTFGQEYRLTETGKTIDIT